MPVDGGELDASDDRGLDELASHVAFQTRQKADASQVSLSQMEANTLQVPSSCNRTQTQHSFVESAMRSWRSPLQCQSHILVFRFILKGSALQLY